MSSGLVVRLSPARISSTWSCVSLLRSTDFAKKRSVCLAARSSVAWCVVDDGREARARRDDGDARAHGAAARDPDGLDFCHAISPSSAWTPEVACEYLRPLVLTGP